MKFLKKYRYLRISELRYNNISQFLFITQITKSREDDELYNFRRIFVIYIYIYCYMSSALMRTDLMHPAIEINRKRI